MNNRTIAFRTAVVGLLAVHMIALVPDASAVDTPEEQVKMLMERHSQVLKKTSHAVLYHKKEGSKPETNKYAWFSEAGELLKVLIQRGDDGEEQKEYFPYEPDGDPKRMMTVAVTRREIPLPNDIWRVEEESLYLARSESGGLLILQKLTKTKDFKARGFIFEMENVPNVVHALEPQEVEVSSAEALKREREFLEEPKKIALALQAAGAPARDPAAERKEAAAARAKEEEAQRSVSPDGQWEFRLTEPEEGGSGYGDFVIAKRGSQETSVALSEQASGSYAEYAKVIWAPDSKRFAFNYRPGFRVNAVQFFQLHGEEWRELDSPDSDDAISAPVERSMAAQRKKLKLSPKVSGRSISDGCEVRRWIDPSTALLHAFSQETFEIKNDLEPVGDAGFVTLKFNAAGDWKIARIRLLESTAAPELNKVEQDELAKMEKESD